MRPAPLRFQGLLRIFIYNLRVMGGMSPIFNFLKGNLHGLVVSGVSLFSAAAAQAQTPKKPAKEKDEISQLLEKLDRGGKDIIQVDKQPRSIRQLTNGSWQYVDGKKRVHTIPADHYNLIKKISDEYKMPLPITLAMIAKESSFDPKAENKTSKARGWLQFVESTLYEQAYESGHKIGYPDAAKLVIKTTINGKFRYQPISDEAAKQLKDLSFNPDFNLRLGIKYALNNIGELQKKLHDLRPEGSSYYPVTPAEAYAIHFMGTRGAANAIRDAHMERRHGVLGHFGKVAKKNETNLNVILDEEGQPYTAQELLEKFRRDMGESPPFKDLRIGKQPKRLDTIEGIIRADRDAMPQPH